MVSASTIVKLIRLLFSARSVHFCEYSALGSQFLVYCAHSECQWVKVSTLVLGKDMMVVSGTLGHSVHTPSSFPPALVFMVYFNRVNPSITQATLTTCKAGQITLGLRSLSSLWHPESLNILMLLRQEPTLCPLHCGGKAFRVVIKMYCDVFLVSHPMKQLCFISHRRNFYPASSDFSAAS